MSQTKSIQDAVNTDSEKRTATILARVGVSMALDNGHDMLDTNPEKHAEKHWASYIRHAVEMYEDESGDTEFDFDELYARACRIAPVEWEDELELSVPMPEFFTAETCRLIADQMHYRWDIEVSKVDGHCPSKYRELAELFYLISRRYDDE